MDPTKIKIDDSMIKKAESDLNNTEGSSEDVIPTSVQLSGSLNLYRIVANPPSYRRGRTLDSKSRFKISYFNEPLWIP